MALRRRKKGGHELPETEAPSLNSLMDIITIILVYLIKMFASNPLDVQDPSLHLPISSSIESPDETPVVMITGAKRREPDGRFAPDTPTIVVDDNVITQLDTNTYRVPDKLKEKNFVIAPLKRELQKIRKGQGATASIMGGEGFSGKITIVADGDTPYRVLSDVLVTCGVAGFDEFKFAIVKEAG
ncbi:MAG: biopolymer transporter ExbD [Myxococcota bacterium]